MKDWNLVVTSHMGQERRLLQELAALGDFLPSGFREVVLGKVPNPEEALETLRRRWETNPLLSQVLSTVVPVRQVFPFTLDNLRSRLQEEARRLAPEIRDRPFYVRVKRRGHKGEISSQEVEQALDQFLQEELASQGWEAHIDFDRAEVILLVELIHNQCGLSLISREMQQRYPFIRVK